MASPNWPESVVGTPHKNQRICESELCLLGCNAIPLLERSDSVFKRNFKYDPSSWGVPLHPQGRYTFSMARRRQGAHVQFPIIHDC